MNGKEPWEEGLEKLPREIEPVRDLWPEIEQRIAKDDVSRARRRRGWPTEWIAAAAAVVVFLAGWGVARLSLPGSGQDHGPRTAAEDGTYRDLDAEYEKAARALLDTLDRGSVPPEEAAQLRRDLAVLDDAVQGLRDALQERPQDARLERQLTTEVRRRHYVLQRIAEIQIAGLQLGGSE